MSCGKAEKANESMDNNKEDSLQILILDSIQKSIQDSIQTSIQDSIQKASEDSIKNHTRVSKYVKDFYNAFELSDKEIQRHYEYGDVEFSLKKFNSLIDKNSKYSKKRVNLLSDVDYHDRYYIKLQSVQNIQFLNNEFEVKTKVLYEIYGMGTFYNEEKLILQDKDGILKLKEWSDIDIYKMELSEYEGLEDFSKKDFYEMMGSINK